MNEEKLTQIREVLEKINRNIPSEADLYETENKLEKIIELLDRQCDILERTENILERIEGNLPESNYVSTSKMEERLEKVWYKLDDMNDNLSYIVNNTDR